ncbi:MAG: hypothetical protein ACYCTW_04420 [Sulfuricella sp.]
MSLALSHPLHQQSLSCAQGNLHRRKIWMDQRQVAYDRRDRNEEESHEKIKSARAAGDDALALVIEEQRVEAYKKEKAVIDRFNFGCCIDVSEATTSAVEVQQHQALLVARTLGLISTSEIFNPTKILAALAILVAKIALHPGAAIRSTPRRPGAPFALLPH